MLQSKKMKTNCLLGLILIALVSGCSPKEQQSENFSVELGQSSFDLRYNTETIGTYTIRNANGSVSVSAMDVPSGITFKHLGQDGTTGQFSFTSTLETQQTVKAKLMFRDNKASISKDITLNVSKKPEAFTVYADTSELTLEEGTASTLNYTAVAPVGEVSLSLKNPVEGLSVSNTFNKSTNKGQASFSTTIREEKSVDVVLSFSDTKTSVDIPLTVKISEKSDPITAVTPDKSSVILYPYGTGKSEEVTFTVDCTTAVKEVTVSCPGSLNTELSLAEDKKSGKVTVSAQADFDSPATVTITAKNPRSEKSASVTFEKAFVNTSTESVSIPANGTTGTTFTITSNVKYNVTPDTDAKSFLTVSNNNGTLTITAKANSYAEAKTGKIIIADELSLLRKEVTVTQSGITEGFESDKAALMALYDSLNMKEWRDHDVWTSGLCNWGVNPNGMTWYGTGWTAQVWKDNVLWTTEASRCDSFYLRRGDSKSTGILPEEIGNLTYMYEFILYGNYNIRMPLPNSISKLKRLQHMSLGYNPLNISLEDWKGLKELITDKDNKFKELNLKDCCLHGSIPEWFGEKDLDFALEFNHLSGQVPEKVAQMRYWNKTFGFHLEDFDESPFFDVSKYETSTSYGVTTVFMTAGEHTIYTQKDNYALWVGERPENTKFVNDEFGGHWEWIVD